SRLALPALAAFPGRLARARSRRARPGLVRPEVARPLPGHHLGALVLHPDPRGPDPGAVVEALPPGRDRLAPGRGRDRGGRRRPGCLRAASAPRSGWRAPPARPWP